MNPHAFPVNLSVVVPVYNAAFQLPDLLDALCAQIGPDHEVIVVDDGSIDTTAAIAADYPVRLLRLRANRGPAAARNAGAEGARGDWLLFTDGDCRPAPDWLDAMAARIARGGARAVMGRVVMAPSNRFGDAVSAIGYPAGGSTGFDKIWRVAADGSTHSLSTCNCAVSRDVFRQLGGFDTDFPHAGGEDSLMAYRLLEAGHRIVYDPTAVVVHQARRHWRDVAAWQFKRGISSRIFAGKIRGRRRYVGLRLWSTVNILRTWKDDSKFPLILALLGCSVLLQGAGFLWARIPGRHHARSHR